MSITARLPPNALVRPPERIDAAYRERFVTRNGRQKETIAYLQPVPRRELAGDDDRIRLRQKHQRIVDDGGVAALEVVLPQAPIAGHVDTEDQDVPLPRQSCPSRRLDDRHRHLHLWYRLDPFQDLLGKPALAGVHLQLRRTRNAIDGACKRIEHRLVRRVHRDKYRDAQNDADDRQRDRTACFLTYGQLIKRMRRMRT